MPAGYFVNDYRITVIKTNGMNFWAPPIHFIITAVHIFSAVFWLGWMVFLFVILCPIASRMDSVPAGELMESIRGRVRNMVFWLIPLILFTGLYNMGYRGLLDWTVLTTTDMGHRMMWKMAAAMILFGIYYGAPLLMGGGQKSKSSGCQGGNGPATKRISILVHLIAFSAGVTAAYLGITIGG